MSKNYIWQLDLTMVKTRHPAFIITNRLVKIPFDKCKLCSKVTAFVFINIIKNILYKFIFSPIKNIRKNATFHIHPFRMYPSAEAIKCAPLNSYLSQVIADGLWVLHHTQTCIVNLSTMFGSFYVYSTIYNQLAEFYLFIYLLRLAWQIQIDTPLVLYSCFCSIFLTYK